MVSGEQINKILEEGPEKAFDIFQEYVQDVTTLTERMQDLYKAEPLLAMLGVNVKVEVFMDEISAMNVEFGCKGLGETLNE